MKPENEIDKNELMKIRIQHIRDTLNKNPNLVLTTEDYRLIMPQEDTIFIKCPLGCYVSVKNFYKYAPFISKNGACTFFESDNFNFWYDKVFNHFGITITNEDIIPVIHKAERKFLELLKINESEGCLLDVSVGIDKSYQDYAKGTSYYLNFRNGLSFCNEGE